MAVDKHLEISGPLDFRTAANIISIGRKVFAKDSNLPDAALGDSDCVELCGSVEQVGCGLTNKWNGRRSRWLVGS